MEADDPGTVKASSSHQTYSLPEDDCDNDDESTDTSSLRPMKKARFMWQIKGNYHLKNPGGNSDMKEDPESFQSEASSSTESAPATNNFDPHSDREDHPPTMCNHHYPSVMSQSDNPAGASNETCSRWPSIRIQAVSVRHACQTFNEILRRASLNFNGESSFHSRSLPISHSDDSNVRKWQGRQIARAFMDNSINCVLEDLGFTPLSDSTADSHAGDVLSSIHTRISYGDEEAEDDKGVENEGILSAIQSHGLQRHSLETGDHNYQEHSSCSPPSTQISNHYLYKEDLSISSPESLSIGCEAGMDVTEQILPPRDLDADNADHSYKRSSDIDNDELNDVYFGSSFCGRTHESTGKKSADTYDDLQSSTSSSATDTRASSNVSDKKNQNSHSTCNEEYDNTTSSTMSSSNLDETCKKRQCKEKGISAVSKRRCAEIPDGDSTCTSPLPSEIRASSFFNDGILPISSSSGDSSSSTFGHFEFMDAAVVAAIQKKGLSALSCQEM